MDFLNNLTNSLGDIASSTTGVIQSLQKNKQPAAVNLTATKGGVPVWIWIAGGAVALLGLVFLLVRK